MVTVNFVGGQPVATISYRMGDQYVAAVGSHYTYQGGGKWNFFGMSGTQIGANYSTKYVEDLCLANTAAYKLVRAKRSKKAKKVYVKYVEGDKYIATDKSVIYRYDGKWSFVAFYRRAGGTSYYEGGSLDEAYVNEHFAGSPKINFTKEFHPACDIKKLGIYQIFWKSGGSSLAAVGNDREGNRWLAPINWVSGSTTDWSEVSHIRFIEVS